MAHVFGEYNDDPSSLSDMPIINRSELFHILVIDLFLHEENLPDAPITISDLCSGSCFFSSSSSSSSPSVDAYGIRSGGVSSSDSLCTDL